MALTQVGRLLRLVTPLGEDVLLAQSVSGHEGLSTPFHFTVTCVAELASRNHLKVKAKELLGEEVLLEIVAVGRDARIVHGMVRSLRTGPVNEHFATFHLEIVPRMALAELGSNSRIFEGLKVTDIVEQVLGKYKTDIKVKVNRPLPRLDFVVQYRETDLNFASRLLERDGLFYFFEHSAQGHVLVITDTLPHTACPLQDSAEVGATKPPAAGGGVIDDWQEHQQLFPAGVTLRDYHFEMPGKTLEVAHVTELAAARAEMCEIYDYPGEYAQRFNHAGERLEEVQDVGEKLAKVRIEEIEASRLQVAGGSTCAAFIPGFAITVKSLGEQQVKGRFVLTQVQHSASQVPDYSGHGSVSGGGYQNRFTCLPENATFHPPRLARKPSIQGPQTAKVIADSKGEEIWPDKYGRVKVFFPWDRTQKVSGWVRVAQQRAGKQGGFLWIPRVGDEVVVAFLEGDPDCPIIVGSVYNFDNPAPYTLPDHKTRSGIKTRSTPGGGPDNFNELRFEDKKDAEEIFLQAERNLVAKVKAAESRTVGGDRTTSIGGNDTRTVHKGDDHLTVESGSQHLTVEQNQIVEVRQQQVVVVGKQASLQVKSGDHLVLVDDGNSLLDVSAGNLTIRTSAGETEISAGKKITLKVGGNTVTIDEDGIKLSGLAIEAEAKGELTMKGLNTKVEAATKLELKGSALASLKADAMVQIESSGVAKVKGSATMIN